MLAGNIKQKHFLLAVGGVGVAALTAFLVLRRGGSDDEQKPEPTASTNSANTVDTPRPLTGPPPAVPSTAPPVVVETPPAATVTPPATTVTPAVDTMRDVDRVLTARAGKDLGGKKVKDAFKGRSFKVNLYQDAGKASVNRAKVDLDRDGKWDEKWTFDGANITRKVAPGDDENYSEKSVWNGKKWVAR